MAAPHRTQPYLAALLLVLGLAVVWNIRPEPATGQGQPPRRGRIDEDLYLGIKRGMIIPYCGEDLPEGYVWADGMSTWPLEAWVPKHLQGNTVPNLNGRVVRGATSAEPVGTPGGSDSMPQHSTASGGEHEHKLPDLRGAITVTPLVTNPGNYSSIDMFGGSTTRARFHSEYPEDQSKIPGMGQHRHNLGGTTASPGAHAHAVPPVGFVPSYVAVRYIIRIR